MGLAEDDPETKARDRARLPSFNAQKCGCHFPPFECYMPEANNRKTEIIPLSRSACEPSRNTERPSLGASSIGFQLVIAGPRSARPIRFVFRNRFCQIREIGVDYKRPLPRLRSLLCLAQRSFPLLVGVVPNAAIRKDSVSNFELSIRFAIEAGCVPGTIKLLRNGFAERAKEGHGYANTPITIPPFAAPTYRSLREGSRVSEKICFEDYHKKFAKGYCALLLAQMSAAGQHDRSTWRQCK